MKKYLVILTTFSLGLVMTACGNANQSKETASLQKENASLKSKAKSNSEQHQAKISDDEYALAAFLKLQGQSAAELKSNTANMHWNQNSNKFTVNFGAHSTLMVVNSDNVEVTYDDIEGDHMGEGNGHKTYSKQALAKIIRDQKADIDNILSSQQGKQSSQQATQQATHQSTQTSNTNTQSQSNDPESTALANGFHDIAGHSAAQWSQWDHDEKAINSSANSEYQQEHGSDN